MKTFLLMSRSTGQLVEGARVFLKDKDTGVPAWEAMVIHLDFCREHDGWIVTSPHKFFGGLRVYVDAETVSRVFEIIGEV
jgi:hypothetical protein